MCKGTSSVRRSSGRAALEHHRDPDEWAREGTERLEEAPSSWRTDGPRRMMRDLDVGLHSLSQRMTRMQAEKPITLMIFNARSFPKWVRNVSVPVGKRRLPAIIGKGANGE